MPAPIKTAVVGATGYAGMELVRLLAGHPHAAKPLLLAREGDSNAPPDLGALFPALSGNGGYPLHPFSWGTLERSGVELLFLATPHQVSRQLAPHAAARGFRVVDLSGAWRLKIGEHEAVYQFQDADPAGAAEFSRRAVYGLPELAGSTVAGAQVVANPGCYATSVILALAPLINAGLLNRECGVVVDSKSGVSGAGKEPTAATHFVSVADNLSAYAVFRHRHVGEIVEQLGLQDGELTFTPHLLPIPRGILSTIYAKLKSSMSPSALQECYRQAYAGCRWVRMFPSPQLPQIQYSVRSNYCDIGFCVADDGRRIVIVSCLDNLLKGAAGQAVQNMNRMYGFSEEAGLA